MLLGYCLMFLDGVGYLKGIGGLMEWTDVDVEVESGPRGC
jgi:hypothetical protein